MQCCPHIETSQIKNGCFDQTSFVATKKNVFFPTAVKFIDFLKDVMFLSSETFFKYNETICCFFELEYILCLAQASVTNFLLQLLIMLSALVDLTGGFKWTDVSIMLILIHLVKMNW